MAKRKNQSKRGRKTVQKKLDTLYFEIKKQGLVGMFFDLLMWPFMQMLMGSWRESAQRTHVWNNTVFNKHSLLNIDKMVSVQGIPGEIEKGFFRFHAPILGGWKNYVVLSPPSNEKEWFIGWVVNDGKSAGYSMIPLEYMQDEVRPLIGPGDVSFFALREVVHEDADDTLLPSLFEKKIMVEQVPLFLVGTGVVGKSKKYESLPLR